MNKHITPLALAALLTSFIPLLASAATTPDYLIYEGRLLDSANQPIETPVAMRFSLWQSSDWTNEDTASGGLVNTGAALFGGWYEVQTVTPNSNGIVSIHLGNATALPTLNYDQHRYLQVEVKATEAPDTSYSLLDPTGDDGADTLDRSFIGSVAYAKNTEAVQNRTIGTASGNIVILGPGGIVPTSHMGSGTDALGFTINAQGTPGDTILTFGSALEEATLVFAFTNSRFEFSGDVHVAGNTTTSGALTVEGAATLKNNMNVGGTITGAHLAITDLQDCKKVSTDAGGNFLCAQSVSGSASEEAHFLQTSGGTMTGALTIHTSGIALEIGDGTASTSTINFNDGEDRFFGWDDIAETFSTFNQQLAFRTLQGNSPPAPCDSSIAGMLWMDTDSDMVYTCSTANGRNKWLSMQDTVLFGEENANCGPHRDIGSDRDCSVDWGSSLGADVSTDLGFYLPRPITITGYGFSQDTSSCTSGSFDLEVWSTGSGNDDDNYSFAADIATALTGQTNNAQNLSVDIDGDQYLLWGIDNNCSRSINDWNLVLYFRWRGE